ncbi:hypothetical protein [Anaerotignum sp.]
MEPFWLFWGRVNEYGQVPVGEYAKTRGGTTFFICVAVAFVFYLLFCRK